VALNITLPFCCGGRGGIGGIVGTIIAGVGRAVNNEKGTRMQTNKNDELTVKTRPRQKQKMRVEIVRKRLKTLSLILCSKYIAASL